MASDERIVELMSIPATDHDMAWLAESLQAGIELEFATLPPYLCAEWSVRSGLDPVRSSIHAVLQEEMLHFGLMCNMLTAIGRSPRMNTADAVPVYPGPLPGGVHPGLTVALRGLSREAAAVFMEIEYPESGPVATLAAEGVPTIGAFYTAIQEAFETIDPSLGDANQLTGPFGLSKIRTPDDVRRAIAVIKRQGEGSHASPDDTGPGDLAHYYRFAEIYHGRRLRKDEATGTWRFDGPEVDISGVRPMAEVPPGGYQQSDVPTKVGLLLTEFDDTFTLMMNQLQAAWDGGDAASLFGAITTMNALQAVGIELMDFEIPSGGGTYGPCFRLAPAP